MSEISRLSLYYLLKRSSTLFCRTKEQKGNEFSQD